jgi:hypothetical protein
MWSPTLNSFFFGTLRILHHSPDKLFFPVSPFHYADPRLPLARSCKCEVSFVDTQGKKHSRTVVAASTFEAVCRAWAQFRASPETCEDSFRTKEFCVEVPQLPKRYNVNSETLLRAISIGRKPDPRSLQRKKWLRKLLDEGTLSR